MKEKQTNALDGSDAPTCSVGPWDGPVRPADGWTKMRVKLKGFRKWTNGQSWVTHEKGNDGCHYGRVGYPSGYSKQSPWGIMNWLNNHPQNACLSRGEGGKKS